MGLYDGYQLANSKSIPEYKGSIVPEMVQVSQELQNRYDKTQAYNDYTARLLNQFKADKKDQQMWDQIKSGYMDKLKKISSRPDLENAVRESSMLAQQLPQDYAPIAANLKAIQDRQEEIRKATEKKPGDAGYLSQSDANALWNDEYSNYKGLQRGADGQLINKFKAGTYTSTVNAEKFVDDALEKAIPQTTGGGTYYHDSTGKYIITKNGEKVILDGDRIKSIITGAVNTNPEIQNYIAQLKRWGTNQDYSRINANDLSLDETGRISELLNKGIPFDQAVKQIKSEDIGKRYINSLFDYGINKYQRQDDKSHISVNEDQYKLKEKDDETPAFTAYINQPLDGYQFTDIKDVHSAKDVSSNMKIQANTDYNNFIKSGVTQTGPQTNPDTKWYKTGPDGKKIDVTDEAKRLLYAYNQASQQEKQWNERISDVYNRGGIKQGSTLVKDAEGIKSKVLNLLNTAKFDGENIAGILSRVGDADVKKYLTQAYNRWQTEAFAGKDGSSGTPAQILANYAYNARIANSPEYRKVNQILKEDNKNGMQMVGVTPLRSKSTNEALGHLFSNLTSNLDNGSLKQGTLGLEWASGNKSGQSLEAGDYSKLKGKSEFAGTGLVNGKLYMYFNVDNTTHSSGEIKGDKMLVRTPAFNGVVETMIKHKMVDQAQLMISDGVAKSLKNPNKSGEAVPGTGIRVEGIPNTVRENSSGAMQGSNLKVIVPLNTGGEKVYNVNSTGEATNLIYNILKAH